MDDRVNVVQHVMWLQRYDNWKPEIEWFKCSKNEESYICKFVL